jgi:VWFA-related protein
VKTLTEVALVREIKGIKQFKLRVCHDRRTYVYDAVAHALKKMRKIPRRKAIVLFSAGFSSNRDATAKSTLRQAEEQEAVIYTIQFNTSHGEPPRYVSKDYYESIKNANNYMAGLAQKTGGRHYRIEDLSDLAKTFTSVADELRRQYTLGYYPKRPLSEGQRRQITVKVRRTGVVVRARDSYVAVPPQQ